MVLRLFLNHKEEIRLEDLHGVKIITDFNDNEDVNESCL